MQRIRAAKAVSDYFRSIDPESRVSESMVRRLMDDGEIPVFMNGVKRLTSIEAVEEYLEKHLCVCGNEGNRIV